MPPVAEFVISAASPKQFLTDDLPEIALVGRSNVGKSSLINSLLQSPKLARTSNTPGRTQTLNFYRVWPEGKGTALEAKGATGAFYFVDMPGYGYAKVSQNQRQAWQRLIEDYLMARPNLCGVIQIVDLRHPPSKEDQAMWAWLRHYKKSRLCVATKADKVPKIRRLVHLNQVAVDLGLATEPPVLFSAAEGLGRAQVWEWVTGVTRTTRQH